MSEERRTRNGEPATGELIEGEDFYREGSYVVFTGKYLLRRGYCCESGCRHCPYGFRLDRRADAPSTE